MSLFEEIEHAQKEYNGLCNQIQVLKEEEMSLDQAIKNWKITLAEFGAQIERASSSQVDLKSHRQLVSSDVTAWTSLKLQIEKELEEMSSCEKDLTSKRSLMM